MVSLTTIIICLLPVVDFTFAHDGRVCMSEVLLKSIIQKNNGIHNTADKGKHPAFFATLTVDRVSLKPLDRIKFNTVFSNEGNGYNKENGFFTAPKKGIYFFSSTVMGTGRTSVGIRLATQLLGTLINGFLPKQHGATHTMSGVVTLKEGDRVYVDDRHSAPSEEIYGRYHTSFLGYMLQ